MGVRLSGWNRQDGSKRKYVYIIIIATLSLISLLATPILLKKSKTKPKKQAIRYLAVTGSVLLAIIIWSIVRRIVQKVSGSRSGKGKSAAWFNVFWWMSHVIYYFTLGYLSPSLFIVSLTIGFAWEFMECYTINWSRIEGGISEKTGNPRATNCSDCTIGCNGYTDILANTLGLSLGLASYYLNQNRNK